LILGGHTVWINGKDIEAQKLVNGNTIREIEVDSAHVYSLCTEKYAPVQMNGMMVMTWQREYWENLNKNERYKVWLQ